ncbi:MAG: hypothetical protein JNK16_11225 [Phycisphaerales bacterium]|nr:hypothetical protein [Phycisphaerales bacterium]
MDSIRNLLQKPAVGWSVAGLAILVALWFFWQGMFAKGTYDLSRMTEKVTIRFADTGDEMVLTRGEFEEQLRRMGQDLKADQGIVNPKTGKPTGILVAARDWQETVNRLNQERAEMSSRSPWGAGAAASAAGNKGGR